MTKLIADRLEGVKPSASGKASQRARELLAAGIDVISLATGEPDFDTPEHVIEAAIAAMRAGDTRYTSVGGTPALLRAVRTKFQRDNAIDYAPNEVMCAPGTKNLIFLALMATLNEGDEVIVPAPHWVSYTDMTRLVGGNPVVVPCSHNNGYKLDGASLEAAITPRTRWLMLNTPSNPTGAVYTPEDLLEIAEVLRRHPQVMLMSDEIYEHILFDGVKFHSFAAVAPDLKERTLTLSGVSKGYAMTGWRVGFAGGTAPLIAAMKEVLSQSSGSLCSISQAASVAALEGPQDYLAERSASFQARRDRLIPLLDAIPGLRCHRPQGAFYLFVECGGLFGLRTPAGTVLEKDADVAAFFLDEARVVVVAGAAYGLSPHVRLSIATSMEKLEEAAARMAAAVAKLSPAMAA
ncbi:pyridoxal phosphate-dependent aminotransferase [Rhodovarius crocodyli]|uniref:pyridoxal phosphate-dependent aminotransferase n=1 Tax=Rhodovarius crocodyli TaxID=1979269 RepID=UPI001F0C059F|nr:pyridoxal phosphate-dependent aminotransferase [Rhodovarius crocodyli]